MDFVKTVRSGRVFHITIDRPAVRNALHTAAYYELSVALDEFEQDDELWLAVLTGAGDKSFSAGLDLKHLAAIAAAGEDEQAKDLEIRKRTQRLTDRFDLVKPIVARLNGSAFGGGLELALACDLVIAADHAQLGLPEPTRGLIAMAGGVHRLPRQIGLKTAMGYLLTGRAMSAARAYELGLLNEVVPFDELDAAVERWTSDILRCAPLSVRATKQCVMQGLNLPLREAAAHSYEWEERRKRSLDALEGPRAFAERRTPMWRGR